MTTYMLHFNDSLEPGYPFWYAGAAGKCHFDRETFAEQIGIRFLYGFRYDWGDEPSKSISVRMDGIFGGLKRNDIVIAHWSLPVANVWIQRMIDKVHLFGSKVIFLIDDVTSWRHEQPLPIKMTAAELTHYKTTDAYLREIAFLKQADGLIVHSRAMATRLRQQAALTGDTLTANVSCYGASGYACNYFQKPRTDHQGVDYAGTLSKAHFLDELPETVTLNVFGADHYQQYYRDKPNINFRPHVDAEAIVQELSGSYGLVWDSDSYPEVTGIYGDYERYNTPAKFPMYLAANEPVIVWSQSPLAEFVTANHIGFAIDNLAELAPTIAAVDAAQYQTMIANVQKIGGLIREGYFVKRALIDIQSRVLGVFEPAAIHHQIEA